jgi:pyrimidine-nucleoside phosphorylase
MMSGRSLGHTGGTLDKLESIPGYRTDLPEDRFVDCLNEVGYSMIGQSDSIVPADRKLYALRDVTATVESIPLITSSILSKKFAEGAQGIIFDVKTGSGAFMKTKEQARALAAALHASGRSLGRQIWAVITDMDQPLGRCVGNFLEVREALDCLQSRGPEDLMEVVVALTSRMLVMGAVADSVDDAEAICRSHLEDGTAWEKFLENVAFQGGDREVLVHPEKGPCATLAVPLASWEESRVKRIDAMKIGLAATILGAGRSRREDRVLPGVGIEFHKREGDTVAVGEPLCVIHAESDEKAEEARRLVKEAYSFDPAGGQRKSLVFEEIPG